MLASFASDVGPWLGAAAFGISLLTFLGAQIQQSRALVKSASSEWVSTLEKEVGFLKAKLAECETDRVELHKQVDALEAREVTLMRRITQVENDKK